MEGARKTGESASRPTLEDEERGGLQRGAAVQANLAGRSVCSRGEEQPCKV